jgi:hypothetical protein
LGELVQLISQRVGRCLERLGLLEQDAESGRLELGPADDTDAMRRIMMPGLVCSYPGRADLRMR